MSHEDSLKVVALAVLVAACGRVPESVEARHSDMAGITAASSNSGGAEDSEDAAAPAVTACKSETGAEMVLLSGPAGTAYCVDTTEVTQGQYAEFLKLASTKPGSEHPWCSDNRSYAPDVGPSYPDEPRNCELNAWTPDATPDKPVVCVGWCDAVAYCQWAGKHLCGKVGGGELAIEESDDPKASEWYNACSSGGSLAYPYGDEYEAQTCLGADRTNQSHSGDPTSAVGPASEHRGCAGKAGPYASLVDLSGSVQEWTDECTWYATPEGGGWLCAVRGGDYLSDAPGLACKLNHHRLKGGGFVCPTEVG